MMKTNKPIASLLLLAGLLSLSWSSGPAITGDVSRPTIDPAGPPHCGKMVVAELVTRNGESLGGIRVSNDADSLRVVVTALKEGWMLSVIHLYAGPFDDSPLNKPGNPKIGLFPYKADLAEPQMQYAFTMPVNVMEERGIISVHAELRQTDDAGGSANHATGWSQGEQFNEQGNWAMYFEYEVQQCPE